MKKAILLFLVCLFYLISFAQTGKPALRIRHLVDSFYVYVSYGEYGGQNYPANAMYMVTNDGVVLFDTPWDEVYYQALLDSIQLRHGKKVVMCISTHYHTDRTGGLTYYSRNGIETYTTKLTDSLCVAFNENRASHHFTGDTTFTIGGRSFEAYYPGPGHTRDNIVLWFPKEKILYGGCFIKSASDKDLGNIKSANVKEWANSIRRLQNHIDKPAYIIVGHNDFTNLNSIAHTLELIQTQTSNVTADIALVGARIYPSPSAAPIENGTVLIRSGKIIDVGSSDKIVVPKSFRIIACKGMVMTAAFWNCHVHFIEPKWNRADTIAAKRFDQQMADMLTSHGFAHVFDLAALDLQQTLRIRNRIKKGDVSGPVIYTAGVPLVPPNGSPFYIAPLKLPEATDSQQAALHVRQQIDSGADGIKLWTGSPTNHGIVHMPVPVVRAIVREAHRLGKPVFAHPTDNQGLAIALNGGVDILAHTTPDGGRAWTADTLQRMLAAHLSVIPTLKLWKDELLKNGIKDDRRNPFIPVAQQQVHDFSVAGGTLLFGTDVGYITDYSTRDEYNLLAGSGLDFRHILTMLTTAPAKQFGLAARTGQIAPGMDADIVLLNGDPATDILSFDKVIYTICKGKFIYQNLTL